MEIEALCPNLHISAIKSTIEGCAGSPYHDHQISWLWLSATVHRVRSIFYFGERNIKMWGMWDNYPFLGRHVLRPFISLEASGPYVSTPIYSATILKNNQNISSLKITKYIGQCPVSHPILFIWNPLWCVTWRLGRNRTVVRNFKRELK